MDNEDGSEINIKITCNCPELNEKTKQNYDDPFGQINEAQHS